MKQCYGRAGGPALGQEPADTTTLLCEFRLLDQRVKMKRQKENKDEQKACKKTSINTRSFCEAGKTH